LNAASTKTTTSSPLIPLWDDTPDPYFEPRNPPTSTTNENGKSRLGSKSSLPARLAPANPASEFNQTKREVVAAASFAVAHLPSIRAGRRKIPPPKPITPLAKPMTPPTAMALVALGRTASLTPASPEINRQAATINASDSRTSYTSPSTSMKPPIAAMGTLVEMNGIDSLLTWCPDLW